MKKRIAFFQDDLLGPGGIQKSLFNLLHNLDYDRVDVTLFLFEEGCYFIQLLLIVNQELK